MEYLHPAWTSMAEALLISALVGIEREAAREERHAGLRDFITIGLAGGICGILNQVWLTSAALLALMAILGIYRMQNPQRTGITTECAAVATFLLCVLTATPDQPWAAPLAIAVTVILVLLLEARHRLGQTLKENFSEREFQDTLRFLAVIFVIYPVLPDDAFGPYGFFNPRRIWLFVILVSSISYIGYFLQKWMGGRSGLQLTGILGGIASTTAATTSFAQEVRSAPEMSRQYAQAAVLANAVQGPRLVALAMASNLELSKTIAPPLVATTVAGVAWAWWIARTRERTSGNQIALRNPFSLMPAVKFGLLFALVRFVVRALEDWLGEGGLYLASVFGGLVDVDAIVFTVAGLFRDGKTSVAAGSAAVLMAWGANALFKAWISRTGTAQFAKLVVVGFLIMGGSGIGVLLLLPK
jgi:uncharacterized membrane protein (DUF4010 family)